MTKVEMTAHAVEYRNKMEAARKAEAENLYRDAVGLAMSAWVDIEGMLQYAKKYENRELAGIQAIDLVLKYAALLLDLKSLDACGRFLSGSRGIERRTTADLSGALAAAREALWQNHRLWTQLEKFSDVRQDQLNHRLGGDAARWRSVAEAWERMGLISRVPIGRTYLLALSTRLGQVVSGKCSLCGKTAQAPKAMFLEPLECPACGCKSDFVLIDDDREPSTAG